MQIKELSKPLTSKALNESLAKQFGYKLKLEQFNDIQLADVQNKLRTEMSQFEVNESFDNLHSNPAYQKTRALLDVINLEIQEREMNEGAKPDFLDMDKDGNKKETMKKAIKDKKKEKAVDEGYVISQFRKRAQQHSVPTSWINNALERIQEGQSDAAELKAELLTRYDLNESQAAYVILEGEEEKAESILASKDMVDRITGWLEDTAAMKAEQLLELLDSIRETQGSDVAQQFQDAVKPALEAVYTALESSRQGLSQGLAILSGKDTGPTMGSPAPEAGAEAGALPGEETPMAPEAGAEEEPGTPPAPEAERMKRESVDYSRRLGILLASKKK